MTRDPTRILSQAEIELEIMAISDALAEETTRYADLAIAAASGEADYKYRLTRSWVTLADLPATTPRMTANERDHRAEAACGDLFRVYRLAEAAAKSSREAMLSMRARIDALRTLSANVRAQT